jgi:hypothetical protein
LLFEQKPKYVNKPLFFLKYFAWYLYLSAITTFLLYYCGILKIPSNDNIFWFIIYHDGLVSLIFLLVTAGLDSFYLMFSQLSVKNIFQFKRYLVKSRFRLFLVDLLFLICISIGITSIKLDKFTEFSSFYKFYFIGCLLFISYGTKFLIWLIKFFLKSLVKSLTPLVEFISLALSMPSAFYNAMSKDISSFHWSEKIKRNVKILLMVFSLALLLYIIFAIIVSIALGISISLKEFRGYR